MNQLKLAAVAVLFCHPLFAQAVTYWGPPVRVGQGTARTWVDMNKADCPTEIGVLLSKKALQGLPEHGMENETLLALPARAKAPPFTHVTVNWNPMGHEPPGIYDAPHFDFHFYAQDRAIQAAITCAGADHAVCMKPPGADYLSADYAPTPEGVPLMGWHWVDLRAPEFNGQPFTSTFLFGYYDGKLTFLEPMVTRAFLRSNPALDQPVRLPAKLSQDGWYPTRYTVRAARDGYRVTLEDLSWRGASRRR